MWFLFQDVAALLDRECTTRQAEVGRVKLAWAQSLRWCPWSLPLHSKFTTGIQHNIYWNLSIWEVPEHSSHFYVFLLEILYGLFSVGSQQCQMVSGFRPPTESDNLQFLSRSDDQRSEFHMMQQTWSYEEYQYAYVYTVYTLGVQRPLKNRYCRFSPKKCNRKAYVCIHGMEAWRALHAFFRWIAFRSSGVGYAPDTKCLWRLSDWHIVEDLWTVWVWKKFLMAQAKLVTVSERRCNQEWSLRQLKRCRASIPHIALWGCWKHLEITLRKELIDKELCNWWFNADSLHFTVW